MMKKTIFNSVKFKKYQKKYRENNKLYVRIYKQKYYQFNKLMKELPFYSLINLKNICPIFELT